MTKNQIKLQAPVAIPCSSREVEMKVALIGATGFVGSAILKEAFETQGMPVVQAGRPTARCSLPVQPGCVLPEPWAY
jgi:hypothetical protein